MHHKFFRVLVLLVFLFSSAFFLQAQTKILTILHTNDTHSTWYPYGPFDFWGGIDRMSNLIKVIKSRKQNVLVLNSGDVFVGTFEFNKYLGYPELKIMEGLYDAMCPGNHEFDLGLDVLLGVVSGQIAGGPPLTLPILCANLNLEGFPALKDFIKPYIVKQVGNVKIGLVGVLETVPLDFSAEVLALLSDPFEAAGQAAYVLKNVENVDVVVCLSHLGKTYDMLGLSQVPGIDVIIGGHSHDALTQPIIANGKIIVQAGEFGRYLGELTIKISSAGVSLRNRRLYQIDGRVKRDLTLAPTLNALRRGIVADPRFGPVYTKRIAAALWPLEKKWVQGRPERDTPLGNLVADAIKRAVGLAGYPVDIALEASGYIAHKIYAGKVVGNDILRAIPYGYDPASGLGFKLDTVLLAGAQIWAGLEYSVSMVEYTTDACMQVSGITFEYDSSKAPVPPEKLLEELSQGRWGRVNPFSIKINGNPMNLEGVYWVALSEQLHKFLLANRLIPFASMQTGLFEYNAVKDCMAELKVLNYTTEGRIIDKAQ